MPKILIAQNKFQVMLKNLFFFFDEKACLCDIYPDTVYHVALLSMYRKSKHIIVLFLFYFL